MNIKILSYLILGLSLSTLGYANEYSTYTSYNQSSSASDQELTKKIKDKLSEGYYSNGFDQVNVQVNKGVVTLTGRVRTSDDKVKIETEVLEIEGVKDLKSKITFLRQRAEYSKDLFSSQADNLLNQEIRNKVSPGLFNNGYSDITLNTTNGVVTLNGYVKHAGDQEKLMTEIQKIEGVKTVKSRVIIQNP